MLCLSESDLDVVEICDFTSTICQFFKEVTPNRSVMMTTKTIQGDCEKAVDEV